MKKLNKTGFTLVEILVVIALMGLFAMIAVPFGTNFYHEQILEEKTVSLEKNLKRAQSYAQSGKENSSWGIAFNPEDADCDSCYVFFKVSSEGGYDDRSEEDKAFDEVVHVPAVITIEGVEEVIFKRGTGRAEIIEE